MRVLELTAHVQHFSRANGRSATAAAAYRACARIACDRENRVHDYRAKGGLEATGIVAPAGAPAWAHDRARLWNAAELRERNGARGANAGAWKMEAMVAREILFGFPAELSPAGRAALADRIARHLVDAHGVAVDWAIHAPGKLGDHRNHHCHMMFSTRRMTAAGLDAKTREWNSREGGGRTVAAIRATLAGMMNEALAGEGVTGVHVEHRSLKARGIGRTPTKHMGPGKTNAGRKRQAREQAAWERQHRHDQAARHEQERTSQARDRAARAEARSRDIDQREARAIEQARVTPEATTTQPQPGRLKRLVRAMTGRADRQQDPTAPTSARVDIERDVRTTYQSERDRMTADHQRDAKALDDRHRSEDRQIERAALARVDHDRLQEVRERQGHAAGRDHDRTHARDEHERQHRQ